MADVKNKNKQTEDGLVEIEQTFPQFDAAKDLGKNRDIIISKLLR